MEPKNTAESGASREKFSTMNTMFLNSTIDKPKVESIIHAVATILHS